MNNYQEYRTHVGITNTDMTRAVKEAFRDFSKITASMVNNTPKYGVCLCPEAEQILAKTFGEGPGLASIPWDGPKKQEEPKKAVRKKPHQVIFRLDDEMLNKLKSLKESSGFASMQEFIIALIQDYADRQNSGKHLKEET